MAAWFKAAVLKTVEPARAPGVRIPLSPPIDLNNGTRRCMVYLIFREFRNLQGQQLKTPGSSRFFVAEVLKMTNDGSPNEKTPSILWCGYAPQ
jgi:hypothetical protein